MSALSATVAELTEQVKELTKQNAEKDATINKRAGGCLVSPPTVNLLRLSRLGVTTRDPAVIPPVQRDPHQRPLIKICPFKFGAPPWICFCKSCYRDLQSRLFCWFAPPLMPKMIRGTREVPIFAKSKVICENTAENPMILSPRVHPLAACRTKETC